MLILSYSQRVCAHWRNWISNKIYKTITNCTEHDKHVDNNKKWCHIDNRTDNNVQQKLNITCQQLCKGVTCCFSTSYHLKMFPNNVYFMLPFTAKVSNTHESTSILTALRLVVTGFRARKKTLSRKSVFGWMIPPSCDTEKSSPRFSSPVRRHDTGSSVRFRIVSVLVSLLRVHFTHRHQHHKWQILKIFISYSI